MGRFCEQSWSQNGKSAAFLAAAAITLYEERVKSGAKTQKIKYLRQTIFNI